MNVVKVMGGIGNQMFQYAFSICCDKPCFLDKSWYLSKDCNRQYLLNRLNCKFNDYDEETPHQLILRYEKTENVYDEDLLKVNHSYIAGYFQSYKYCDKVRDRLIEDFKPLDEPTTSRYLKMKDKILNSNSVSISIRRGDYLSLSHLYTNLWDIGYYTKAISTVEKHIEDPKYFVFSDDLEWCRQNLKGKNFTFVDSLKYENRDELGITLMSYCKTNIIANSTYSWWGAYLNQNSNKTVIAPSVWFNDNRSTEIIPSDRWLLIPSC